MLFTLEANILKTTFAKKKEHEEMIILVEEKELGQC